MTLFIFCATIKQQEVKINMTEELITTANKNGKDRSVSNADRLLTPGSDKAGDLGKAALLPVPGGVPLLEAGASNDERKP